MKIRTLPEMFRRRADVTPDRTAFVLPHEGTGPADLVTYSDLHRRAGAIAGLLAERVNRGDRIVLVYSAQIDLLTACVGCFYRGVIAVPVAPPRQNESGSRLRAIVADCGAAAILTTMSLKSRVITALGSAPESPRISVIVSNAPSVSDTSPAVLEAHEADVAYLQYTSGSTTAPRGVIVSHANVLSNLNAIDHGFRHTPESVGLTWLPAHHDMGLVYGLLQPVHSGYPCVVFTPAVFVQRPLTWLEAISRFHVTHSGGPDSAYELCVARFRPDAAISFNLGSWRIAFSGAEPVKRQTLAQFTNTFAPYGFSPDAFRPSYGLAEATLKVTSGCCSGLLEVSPREGGWHREPISCGAPTRPTDVRIVNPESGVECGAAETGEIWVSGPGVAIGYWNRPEETRATFQAVLQGGACRYLRTGDLGFIRRGELHVTGRIKDLIIVGGESYHPHDLETSVTALHPGFSFRGTAAFGVDATHEVVVCQELRRNADVPVEETAQAIRAAIWRDHGVRVGTVVFVPAGAIPRTSSGKIRRYRCCEKFLEGTLDAIAASSISVREPAEEDEPALSIELGGTLGEDANKAIAAKIRAIVDGLHLGCGALDPQVPLYTYGLDSLSASRLAICLERTFRITLPAGFSLQEQSCATLAEAILNAASEGATHASAPSEPQSDLSSDFPLTSEQQRLWYLERRGGPTTPLWVPLLIRFRGPLQLDVLRQAIRGLVDSHEALRTYFPVVNGEPVQRVLPRHDPFWTVVFGDGSQRGAREVVEGHLNVETTTPIDVAAAVPLRCTVVQTSADEHWLILNIHHLLTDGWSNGLLLQQLMDHYATLARGGRLVKANVFQMRHFTTWHQRRVCEDKTAAHAFWTRTLADVTRPLPLPVGGGFSAAPERRAVYEVFARDTLPALQSAAQRHGRPWHVLLLAAYVILLKRLTGRTVISVGVPTANRDAPWLHAVVGCLAQPLVVKASVRAEATFAEVVEQVAESLGSAVRHRLPFAEIAAITARSGGSRNPCQCLFTFLYVPVSSGVAGPTTITPEFVPPAGGDVGWVLTAVLHGDEVHVGLAYDGSTFSEATMQFVASAFRRIVVHGLSQPLASVRTFHLGAAPGIKAAMDVIVAGTFSTEPAEPYLRELFERVGLRTSISCAPSDQIVQELLLDDSSFAKNAEGINVMALRISDLGSGPVCGATRHLFDQRVAAARTEEIVSALESFRTRSAARLIVCVCPEEPDAGRRDDAARNEIDRVLAKRLSTIPALQLVTSATFEREGWLPAYFDSYLDAHAGLPYTSVGYAAFSLRLARAIYGCVGLGRKVVVADCDNTLWDGILGEDGPEGICVDANRRRIQQRLASLAEHGMVICLCTKNNEHDVREVFRLRSDFALREEHISAIRANWNPKTRNVRDLAAELCLPLDSFVFLDDDPVECAEMRRSCAQVLTFHVPAGSSSAAAFIERLWVLDDPNSTTAEDAQRAGFYRANLSRLALRRAVADYRSYLTNLRLTITVRAATEADRKRIAQLVHRTTQFTTTGRLPLSDLNSLNPNTAVVVHVADRYGDYGIVGTAAWTIDRQALDVSLFALSCRALGRRVEHAMCEHLAAVARECGATHIVLRLRATDRNHPARSFFKAMPHDADSHDADALVFTTETFAHCSEIIEAVPQELKADEPPEQSGEAAAPSFDGRMETDCHALVEGLSWIASTVDSPSVLAAIVGRSHRGSAREPGSSRDGASAPDGEDGGVQAGIRELWLEVLPAANTSEDAEFFASGGDSLIAMQLLSLIRRRYGIELTPDQIFERPLTLKWLGELVETEQLRRADPTLLERVLTQVAVLSDEEIAALSRAQQD